jgi:hypothetical protein
VKILPATSPPATLVAMDRGLNKAFDTLIVRTFPRQTAPKHAGVN